MKKLAVLIPRPNQSFHVHFAVIAAAVMVKRGNTVDVVVCNNSESYCSTKFAYNVNEEKGSCSPCDAGIHHLKIIWEATRKFMDIEEKSRYSLILTSAEYEKEIATEEEVELEYKKLDQLYGGTIDQGAEVIDWLSEACTITGLTPKDLSVNGRSDLVIAQIKMTIRQRKLAARMISERQLRGLLLYNGRISAAKAWASTFRANKLVFIVHERGLHPDSFTLNKNWTVEEHFRILPESFYPTQRKIEDIVNGHSDVEIFNSFLNYISPKLTGEGSYYNYKPIRAEVRRDDIKVQRNSEEIGKKHILILASSYDEVSSPMPFDRIRLEEEYICSLVETLTTINSVVEELETVVIRFHPRSGTQLMNSKAKGGCYAEFISRLKATEMNHSGILKVIEPDDVTTGCTSYELLRNSSHVISLFSITAIEAAAMGKKSICHKRCRGSNVFRSVLDGNTAGVVVDSTLKWLMQRNDEEERNRVKRMARAYLGKYLESQYIYPNSFKGFYPYNGNLYHENLSKSLNEGTWLDDDSWIDMDEKFNGNV